MLAWNAKLANSEMSNIVKGAKVSILTTTRRDIPILEVIQTHKLLEGIQHHNASMSISSSRFQMPFPSKRLVQLCALELLCTILLGTGEPLKAKK